MISKSSNSNAFIHLAIKKLVVCFFSFWVYGGVSLAVSVDVKPNRKPH